MHLLSEFERNLKAKTIKHKDKTYHVSASTPSSRQGKKRMRKITWKEGDKTKKKTVHYGHTGYENYGGSEGKYVHKDKKRRKNYLIRAGGIKNKDGSLASKNPLGANKWAMEDLW